MQDQFLPLTRDNYQQYKTLGDKTLVQLSEPMLHWQYNEQSLSVATIIKHLHGNMLSRFTDFLSSDGEKEWRQRDEEFIAEKECREIIVKQWEEGWAVLFRALEPLTENNLQKTVLIRNEPHTVMSALCRQLTHYVSHIGQIIVIAKMCLGKGWQTLFIARGGSKDFNARMFAKK